MFTTESREKIRNFLLCLGFSLFLAHYLIENIFGLSGYVLGAVAYLSAVAFSPKRKYIPYQAVFAIIVLFISIVSRVLFRGYISSGFFETFVAIILFPLLGYMMSFTKQSARKLIRFVALTSIYSAIGVSVYYINLFFPAPDFLIEVLKVEYASSYGEVQVRNISFYGASLVLGGISLIQLCCSAYCLIIARRNDYLMWLMLSLALFCVFASLARRAYVPAFVVLVFLFYFSDPKTRAILGSIAVSACAIFLIAVPNYLWNFFLRLTSIVDFSDQSNNSSRLVSMANGVRNAFENPFGVGLGSLSSLGKEYYTITEELGFKGVTESFYITLVGEVGIVQVSLLLLLTLSFRKNLQKDLRFWIIAIPFLIESIMGLSLMNPVIAILVFTLLFIHMEGDTGFTKSRAYNSKEIRKDSSLTS